MTLAEHVHILGRGPGRARSLTQSEARDAMALMLSGTAPPEAIGAVLMLLRMKGETAAEIAGFASAAQDRAPALPAVDLDWPSYAAGRTRGLAWFLLSAKLVAQAGHRVLLHGWNGPDPKVRDGLASAGITTAQDTNQAGALLLTHGITYVPLEQLHPALLHLLRLRDVLGLRSCINTVCRMLNPGRAGASVQGVFHPSYRLLQSDAAALLDRRALCVIKGGGGEFERHPGKPITVFGLANGTGFEQNFRAELPGHTRLNTGPLPDTTLDGLWSGAQSDPFAQSVVTGTAALALGALGHAAPDQMAQHLWATRPLQKDTTA